MGRGSARNAGRAASLSGRHRGALAIVLVLTCVSASAKLRYAVHIDARDPLVANFEMKGPDGRPFGGGKTVAPRGQQFGSAVQVDGVRCDGRLLTAVAQSTWRLPDRGCRRLNWRSPLVELGARGVDASRQHSLYAADAGFWLIAEPASLLRVSGFDGEAPMDVRGPPLVGTVDGRTAQVPGLAEAPGFFVLGAPSLRRMTAAGIRAIHVNATKLDLAPIERLHAESIEFFMRVTGTPSLAAPIVVVWLPVDASVGEAGGAAGRDGFLANVVVRDGAPLPEETPLTLHVLLHEQFHQLVRPPTPLPTWLNESLAEFYARRAAEEARLDAGARAVLEARYPPLDAAPRVRLLQIQREIDAGNGENYARLYIDGSNFWMAVHRAIVANGHAAGIDDLMPLLLARPVPTAELPASWIGSLREAAGPAFDELMARFVGS